MYLYDFVSRYIKIGVYMESWTLYEKYVNLYHSIVLWLQLIKFSTPIVEDNAFVFVFLVNPFVSLGEFENRSFKGLRIGVDWQWIVVSRLTHSFSMISK